jgi:hypothetical protein
MGLFNEAVSASGYVTRDSPDYLLGGRGGEAGPSNAYDPYLDPSGMPQTTDYWRQLGYNGPVTSPGGEWGGGGIHPELLAWMQANGYQMGQNGQVAQNALVGPKGVVPGSQYSTDDTGDFMRDALLLIGGGYFGGGALAGAGEGAAVLGAGETVSGAGVIDASAAGIIQGGSIPSAFSVGGLDAGGVAAVGVDAGAGGYAVPALEVASSAPAGSSLLSQVGQGLGNIGGRDWVSIISGLYGMNLASKAGKQSDPFASQRPGYAAKLAELEANPNLITQRPGWQAGLETINRQMASKGYTGSGNQVGALSRYAGDFYGQEMQRLAGLAGAGIQPGQSQFHAADLAGQSLASIGYGLAPYLRNGASTPSGGGGGGYNNLNGYTEMPFKNVGGG